MMKMVGLLVAMGCLPKAHGGAEGTFAAVRAENFSPCIVTHLAFQAVRCSFDPRIEGRTETIDGESAGSGLAGQRQTQQGNAIHGSSDGTRTFAVRL